MKSKKNLKADLRKKAEAKCLQEPVPSINELKSMSLTDIVAKLHELHVHKIELEMQNEELYKTQLELYNAKMRYFELYDMAPVGYLTLGCDGIILDANLASADTIGTSREQLKNKALSDFIFSDDQDLYYLFRKKIADSQERQVCKLRMQKSDGNVFWAQIIASPKNKDSELSACKLIFNDITESKTLEAVEENNEKLHTLSKNILIARENERKSLAREVHDQLGQLMTALKIDLTWFKRKLPQGSEELITKVDAMLGHINLGIQSIRDIVVQLRPLILDDLGLEAAMEWHAQRYLTSAHIEYAINFEVNEALLDEDLKIVLFRIFQEALTNVIRHSKATKTFISLTQKSETLILQITDNGIGVTQEQIDSSESFGLIGIRERLYPYAGVLEVSDHEGLGTSLRVTMTDFKKEATDD
ncbi:PAS domain S-box protein [bacterium]|nr:PAS domain S-box protein [bacterium]MBU4025586.1 PAS domain S-box protein [bacterium]MBU4058057.1 PAS domain S-box protein [bacterium]